jgi:hypothetical protein
MSCRHILVQGLDRVRPAHLTILLVHVVGARAGVIADPDAEVLDLEWALLVDDVEGDDLAVGLLDLAQLHQEVPEARFRDDRVVGKYSHAVEFRGGICVGGQVAPDHLILCEAPWGRGDLAWGLKGESSAIVSMGWVRWHVPQLPGVKIEEWTGDWLDRMERGSGI